MSVKFQTVSFLHQRKYYLCMLAVCSLIGALFGVFFAGFAGSDYLHFISYALQQPITLSGLIVSVFIPYLILTLFIFNRYRWFAAVCICIRIFMFAAALSCIYRLFSTGGWLIGVLFQFPDMIMLPYFILHLCSDKQRHWLIPVFVTTTCSLLYYLKVSPFLAILLDKYQTMGRYAFHVGFNWCL